MTHSHSRIWASQQRISANAGGVVLRANVWTNCRTNTAPGLLLIHGFLDCADNWDDVVAHVTTEASPWPVVAAVDLRGHGRSGHIGRGGLYNFVDYQCDIEAILDVLDSQSGKRKWILMGHSMGGGVAALYAGLRPERVAALAVLEGIHVPDTPLDTLPDHTRGWLDDQKKWALRRPQPMPSLDEAVRRFGVASGVDESLLKRKVRHLVRRQGAHWYWRYDPRHRARFAIPYLSGIHEKFWQQVQAPLWIVEGEDSFFRGLADDRLHLFASLQQEVWPGVGHFMHWQNPQRCAELAGRMLTHISHQGRKA